MICFRVTRNCLTALALLILLAACARPLTPNEDAFAEALFGDSLDRETVSVRVGIGVTPLPQPEGAEAEADENAVVRDVPEGFCDRKPQPQRRIAWPAAFVLYDDVFFSYEFYSADTFAGWPVTLPLPQSLIMAHELVHVWQWQNRDQTEYRPLVSAGESIENPDPYYWQTSEAQEFLAFGYEQQAAMVEDYLCYRLFDPTSPRLKELHDIIDPTLPLDGLEGYLPN